MTIKLPYRYTLLSIVLMSIYGVMVCPFVDSLSNGAVVLIVSVGFGCQALLLFIQQTVWVEKLAYRDRPRAQFISDFSTYLLVGIGLTLFNFTVFDFPLESGLKLMIGTITLGLFAATDNALYRERRELNKRAAEQEAEVSEEKLFPITAKLSLFIGVVALLTIVVMVLVLYKDTAYLLNQDMDTPMPLVKAIFIDISFVMIVVIGLGFKVMHSYSRNLKQLFEFQIDTLASIEKGDLEARAPLLTQDEFRVIAQGTNRMIVGLKEKEKIRDRFGKAVSPQIAERLLSGSFNELGAGQNIQVVTLLCDLRGFTAKSEQIPARQLVSVMNEYFTEMVRIVEKQGGIVDKFIGDAILAVFGLEADSNDMSNAEKAVMAALEMTRECQRLHWPNGEAMENGAAVHLGPAISGIIGAPGRHEFTVIGDVINTTSRIEQLCRPLEKSVLISSDLFTVLPEAQQILFTHQGKHHLRGKQLAVGLYGL